MTEQSKITAIGIKDGFEVIVSFETYSGSFWLPQIRSEAPDETFEMWTRFFFEKSIDPNLYSVVPRIPPFGSVERVETMLSRFFGVNDEGKINATVKYENCEPYQDEEEEESGDVVY